MYRTLACLAFEHDQRLVALAAAVCILGAVTALRVIQIAFRSEELTRFGWLAAAAVAGGGSVWTTHFVAMLAYDPGVVIGYDPWPIFASLAAAIALPGAGFTLFLLNHKWVPYAGGVLVGLGISGLHYIGMTGVVVPGRLEWDPGLITASVLFSIFFSIVALYAVRNFSESVGVGVGTAALVVAVVLLHFVGMGALTVVPDPSVPKPEGDLSPALLAAAATVVTAFLLLIALLCIAFDRRLVRRQAEAEQRIQHVIYHDTLTGLPNRAFLMGEMDRVIAAAAAGNSELAVLALDLDRFKQVNDLFGHPAGDALLKDVAATMSRELGSSDIAARVAGDEFVIVQCGVAQPRGAQDLAARLLTALCREFDIEGARIAVAASIGIALFPRDGTDAATLHPNADAALRRAKDEGRACFRIFEPSMDLQQRERCALQVEMREALKRGEFRLYYQPQAETLTGVISGFEALLRWVHPQRGLIDPGHFVSAAEENGFMVELGEFVLRTACAEAASWRKPLNIAVNLSPVQFQHGDLVGLVRDVLRETGLRPGRLELEITENVLIHDTAKALQILNGIKQLGVCVAMDDFGTGYSSLAYLQAFPFDRIKIDQSFIAKLHENKQSQAIIRAIVGLGRGLDVPVIAEGVETDSQQMFLADLDCAEIQGFLIGRPQPIELFEMHTGGSLGRKTRRAVA